MILVILVEFDHYAHARSKLRLHRRQAKCRTFLKPAMSHFRNATCCKSHKCDASPDF